MTTIDDKPASIAGQIRAQKRRTATFFRWDEALDRAADIAAAGEAALRADIKALRHDLSRIKDHETALVNENEALRAKVEQAGRDLNVAKYGQPNFAWQVHLAAMDELRAERDRLAADLEVAREALAFYADPTLDGYDLLVTNYGLSTEEGVIIQDAGDRARAALARIAGGDQ